MKDTGYFVIRSYSVTSERTGESRAPARAEVEVQIGDRHVRRRADGVGPVHALDNALRACLERVFPEMSRVRLCDYGVSVVDPDRGTGARVHVSIRATDGEESWDAGCVSDNVIDASFEALCSAAVLGIMRARRAERVSA